MLDTKLKNFSRQWYVKLCAYVVILAMAAGFVLGVATLAGKVSDPSAYESKNYVDSNVCDDEISRVVNNLMVLQYDYVSEERIKSGDAVDTYTLYRIIYESEHYRENVQQPELWTEGTKVSEDELKIDLHADNADGLKQMDLSTLIQEHPNWEFFQEEAFIKYLTKNPEIIYDVYQSLVDEQLRNFVRVKTFLDSVQGQWAYYSYRAESNVNTTTATEEDIRQMPVYAEYDIISESVKIHRDGQDRSFDINYYSTANYESYDYRQRHQYRIGTKDKLLVGIHPEYLKQREAEWQNDHYMAMLCIVVLAITILSSCMLTLYLCLVTGRKPDSDKVHLCWLDKVYSEVHLAVLIAILCIFTEIMTYGHRSSLVNMWPMYIAAACGICGIGLPLILSLLRSLKAQRFIHSFAIGRLIVRFCKWAMCTVRSIWAGGNLMLRGMLIAVFVPVLCIPWITIPFLIAGLCYFAFRTISRFQEIQKGVREVRQGNLEHKINVNGGDLGSLASDINTLSEGLENAISAEVRSERLKTELISNVSHDIKTPLTSIVTYVDLLKTELAKEQSDLETITEYVNVIDKKTARLRMLTTDLFEAAKATSGAMNVELEQVDVQALIRQGLGEFDDKLSAAQLDMRVTVPEKPCCILADGRLVWRIFENMLSNVVKYALQGSRVYVDVTTGHGMVTLTMKNISAYELNVPAEELMERFKRGDESRSSEGSGLGLSIAMSLAQLQHGIFTVSVDGDLFKAVLSMPAYDRNRAIPSE